MENKQTAVEWLESEFDWVTNYMMNEHKEQVFNKAKAMEADREFETKAYWFGRGIQAGMEGRIGELKPTRDGK